MKWQRIFLHKAFILSLCLVLVSGLAWYGIKTLQERRAEHDAFIGDIENLYYFLKKEPFNMETYSVLQQGDSVAISVWQNVISTSEMNVKKYDLMINEHLHDYAHFNEIEVLKKLSEALEVFKEIRSENRERVEGRPEFDMSDFQEQKEKLNAILGEVLKLAKEHKIDLR
jgi:hypothetical protein